MAGELYRNHEASIDDRVEDLLGRMTLDEKLAQLGCVWSTALVEDDRFSADRARELLPHGTGHITRIGASTGLRPAESAAFMNEIQRFCVNETRLGIPAIVHEESTGGFCARDATQFPQAIGLAATWDPRVVEEVGTVIREQMRAVGARLTLAPVLDVTRDPRWGRTEETYGEDPYLASRIGVAYVRGMQTNDLRSGVACTGKHFLAYGASEGGFNHAPAHVGARELREVYAAPFAAAIREAGLAAIMNAYNEVDGLPCAGSRAILTDLLRDELGFTGVVVADYLSVMLLMVYHRVAADPGDAGQRALEAGLDVELPATDCYGDPLKQRLADGRLATDVVDTAVRRALRLKFALGLFEEPYVDAEAAPSVYDTPEQRELARRTAQRSLVLLRNDGVLPLDPSAGGIAVIGPAADDARLLLGDYHYPAHLEIIYATQRRSSIVPTAGGAFGPGPHFVPMTTPLDAIRNASGSDVVYAKGCDVTGDDASGIGEAVQAAREASVAVVFVGGRSGLTPDCTSGEFRDASDLGLPGLQKELVEAVLDTGTPTVVVVISGRVHSIPQIAERAAAILYAWLPGEEGGPAIADVLFGNANPAGRLPISMPRSVGQVPVYASHKSGSGGSQIYRDYVDGSCRPLFPFGHGLGYTSFSYADLEISPGSTSEPFEVSAYVTNDGDRDGEEVVQLYLHDEVASVTRPARQLAGFARVPVAAGQSRRVRFAVDPSVLAFYDEDMRLVVEPGTVGVMVGASSDDIRLRGSVELTGDVRELTQADIRPTAVSL